MWLRLRSAYEGEIVGIGMAGRMKAVRHLNLKIWKDGMKEPIFASPRPLTTVPCGEALDRGRAAPAMRKHEIRRLKLAEGRRIQRTCVFINGLRFGPL